jgi:hypothetical protein
MESLQFQKAEYSDPRRKCVACSGIIERSYFQLSGQNICPTCAEQAGAKLSGPTNSKVMRGLLYGAGAALACCICYAIITVLTGRQLALATIAVGYLIGRAVRTGSNGLGGRRCQIIAVVLTYVSITTAYIPLLIKDVREHAHTKAGATAGTGKSQQESPKQPEVQTKKVSGALPLALVLFDAAVLLAVALASPFLMLTEGVSGFIGLAILSFGLLQAWKQTARPPHVLAGPFTLEETPSAT